MHHEERPALDSPPPPARERIDYFRANAARPPVELAHRAASLSPWDGARSRFDAEFP
jgi:hypothetical protein